LAVRKFGSQSWKAWTMSLAVDLASRGLMRSAFSNRKEGQMTPLEADEYGRRAYLLLYYLLRGPFYQHFTKYVICVLSVYGEANNTNLGLLFFRPRIEAFCDATETRPVASIIAGCVLLHCWIINVATNFKCIPCIPYNNICYLTYSNHIHVQHVPKLY
jgi:peroxin-16